MFQVQVQELPPVTVNGKDLEAFYKGEIARCVRDIQQEYDQQLSAMTMDIEAKYAAQVGHRRVYCLHAGKTELFVNFFVSWCILI